VSALETVAATTPVAWEVRPIDDDPALALRFSLRVPVLEVDGREVLEGRVDVERLRAVLSPGVREELSDLAEVPDLDEAGAPGAASGDDEAAAARAADRLSAALGLGPTPTMSGPRATSPRVPRRAFPDRVRPAAASPGAPSDRMVSIPAGEFLYGPARRRRSLPAFEIDRDPVSHADYHRFVAATGHRAPPYWRGPAPPAELRDHPVVGVDYVDALAYARWAGKDLPYDDEWERAARGTDGREHPWGPDPDGGANTSRTGLAMTLPIGWHAKNVSPEGCRDLVGNTWEWTHSPTPDGGVVVRGGSWFDPPERATSVSRFASRRDARNGTLGFRCVRRPAPRDDVPPTLSPELVDAEIEGRRGLPSSGETWVAGERDLVPDVPRLRALGPREGGGVAADDADAEAPRRPGVKKAWEGAPDDARPAPAPRPAAPRREPERPLAISSSVGASAQPGTTSDTRAVSVAGEGRSARVAPPSRPHVARERAAPRPAPRPSPSPRRRGLVVAAVLVGIAVAAAAVYLATSPREGGREESPRPAASGLPEPTPGPGDDEPPRVGEGAASALSTAPQSILVFSSAAPGTPVGDATAALALDLHRRLRPWTGRVEVVLVLPRTAVAEADLSAAARALRAAGVAGDLRVHLDAAGEGGGAGPARHAFGLGEGTYALLVRDGVEALRASAGSDALALAQIEPLVAAALSRAGR
jgi:formylglycine-generating enzyme required for sulfatase activity